ncbi:lysine exporter LysO family protein [Desulfobotulus sp. H1]|uniref:Lysine exporter LysO family protein n=1 Tax=Desulfobotulus pelophilus TaxID=2823377 RepID=A0ABT3N4W4_9BACT|nr:LysO family transporter [Desulfobotulus pelophilus]MCW7752497.1 lysine exporter LysO family protein [Desulfobotulus pelophilus]
MENVLFFLSTGLVAGFLLRNRTHLLKASDHAASWAVYLLLFFLGASTGLQPEILSMAGTTGFFALVLSLAATAGSIILVWPLYHFLFRTGSHPRTQKADNG